MDTSKTESKLSPETQDRLSKIRDHFENVSTKELEEGLIRAGIETIKPSGMQMVADLPKVICDFCSKQKETQEIYGDLQICSDCKLKEDKIGEIAASIEG